MKKRKLTTFELSEETKKELSSITKNAGLNSRRETVELLIHNFGRKLVDNLPAAKKAFEKMLTGEKK